MLDALDWLDTHFTFSKDQVCSLLVKRDGGGGFGCVLGTQFGFA